MASTCVSYVLSDKRWQTVQHDTVMDRIGVVAMVNSIVNDACCLHLKYHSMQIRATAVWVQRIWLIAKVYRALSCWVVLLAFQWVCTHCVDE